MNEIVVPVDLTEEEKEILAIFSIRQFLIVFPSAIIAIGFLVVGNLPLISGLADFLIRLFMSLISIIAAILMAFFRLDRHDMYLSEFVITKIKFMRSQKRFYP